MVQHSPTVKNFSTWHGQICVIVFVAFFTITLIVVIITVIIVVVLAPVAALLGRGHELLNGRA